MPKPRVPKQQRKRVPPRGKRQVQPSRKQPRVKRASRMSFAGAWDASNNMHVARPLHNTTPYTVIRERILFPFSTTAGQSGDTIILGQSNPIGASGIVVPIVGAYYDGTAGPTAINSTMLTGNTLARARIHRLSAKLAVTGVASPAGTSQLLPDGLNFMGVLNTPFDYDSFPSVAAVQTWLTSRTEMVSATNYQTMSVPRRAHCRMLDKVSYDTFKLLGSLVNVGDTILDNSLAPLVIYVPQTVGTISYQLTIHVEWAVQYTGDPVLQSTARLHKHASESWWDSAAGLAFEAGAGLAASAAWGARQAGAIAPRAARALPALGWAA